MSTRCSWCGIRPGCPAVVPDDPRDDRVWADDYGPTDYHESITARGPDRRSRRCHNRRHPHIRQRSPVQFVNTGCGDYGHSRSAWFARLWRTRYRCRLRTFRSSEFAPFANILRRKPDDGEHCNASGNYSIGGAAGRAAPVCVSWLDEVVRSWGFPVRTSRPPKGRRRSRNSPNRASPFRAPNNYRGN